MSEYARRTSSTVPMVGRIRDAGRFIALAGVVLPLLMIGALKFTAIEIETLKPLIGGTPWLAWLYSVFGETGASYLLGTVELVTAALLVASSWSARASIIGGAMATAVFATTASTMLALPIWESASGGFPWLNPTGQFLMKDIALLGISLGIFADGVERGLSSRQSVAMQLHTEVPPSKTSGGPA